MLNFYPKAKIILADPSNFHTCFPKRATFSLIVDHITDGRESAENVADMWQQFGHKSSAHFVIGSNGTVIQSVDLGDIAWHAHDMNAISVGIEHCGRTPGELGKTDPGLALTPVQMEASAELHAWLLRVAGLPIDRVHIVGHAEVDKQTTHTGCPASVLGGWDWDAHLNRIGVAAQALAASLQ
jgi:N-acetyl-anhydromuramyl-L-alanine amidase AmpD